MTAADFSLALSEKMDVQYNVPVVVQHGKEHFFVHFYQYDAQSLTITCSTVRVFEATIADMQEHLTRSSAIAARRVLVKMLEDETLWLVTGLSDKTHYRDRYGEHNAVILTVEALSVIAN